MPNDIETFDAVLGVARSFGGSYWKYRSVLRDKSESDKGEEDRQALAIAHRFGLPEILGRILAMRGVCLEDVGLYLKPRLRDWLPDPSTLRDLDIGVERLVKAIDGGERIAVFGDYDVDGATSTALIVRFLAMIGHEVIFYIPDRQKEGYGPNIKAFETLHAQKANLVLTVDCGTMAHTALARAKQLGLDVIVVDHHQTGQELPDALAVINPRRVDDESGLQDLAAVGVVFMLLVGLARALRKSGYFAPPRLEPNLMSLLDLVALGTVCDVVPLLGLNRAFVAQGLAVMAQGKTIGLRALAGVAKSSPPYDAYNLGFQFGPRINAGGRVGASDLGVRLLSTQDYEEAVGIAARLDEYNGQRREIESQVLAEAQKMAQTQIEKFSAKANTLPPVLVLAHCGWHVGVIGIVAGRLKEKFNRPCFVIAFDEQNGASDKEVGKGSARSIAGIDIGSLVAKAVGLGVIAGGGGHAMAAGVNLTRAQIAPFTEFLHAGLKDKNFAMAGDLSIDTALSPEGATREFYDMLQQIGPFGASNPEPRFVLPSVHIVKADVVGAGHVRCILRGLSGKSLKAIAFASTPEEVRANLQLTHNPCHIVGFLRADDWQGRRDIQFIIHDVARA